MKWYKKQMDKLKEEKPELFAADDSSVKKKKFARVLSVDKVGGAKSAFSSPVAARNRNRPKTDAK